MRRFWPTVLFAVIPAAWGQIEPVEEDLVRTIGVRIVALSYVDQVHKTHVTGSGILIDGTHVLTAAHVVANVDRDAGLVVQVGTLRNPVEIEGFVRSPFLTTGKVKAMDASRDLAIVEVVSELPLSKMPVCPEQIKPGSKFLLGSSAVFSNIRQDPLQATWLPLWRQEVLNITQFPKVLPPQARTDVRLHVHSGDPIIALSQTLMPGDSGAAVIGESGCLAGIVSFTTYMTVKPPELNYSYASGVTVAMPIRQGDPLLKN